jgi:hypothetical protein
LGHEALPSPEPSPMDPLFDLESVDSERQEVRGAGPTSAGVQ